LSLTAGGVEQYRATATEGIHFKDFHVGSIANGYAQIVDEVGSATNPIYTCYGANGTGVGFVQSLDLVSLIGGGYEGFRVALSGAEAKVGFFGGAVVRQNHIADANTSHAITDPVDSPATADLLRDDLVANAIPEIETALNALGTKFNTLLSYLEAYRLLKTS
jgi:hypothetical protein